MKIDVMPGDITKSDSDAIIINLFEGVTSPSGATGAVDKLLSNAISLLISDGEIKGKAGEMTLLHTMGRITPKRVLIAGLGKQTDFSTERIRSVAADSVRYLENIGVTEATTIAHGAGIGAQTAIDSGRAISEGALLGLYKFNKYKSAEQKADFNRLTIMESSDDKIRELRKGAKEGVILAESVNMCRDMCNEPANGMTPSDMAEVALKVAKAQNLNLKVLERPQMKELGMGALLGVAQGSHEPPKFIIMSYEGDPDNQKNNIGLLGKGITFDSGGLDIKSAAGMSTMKSDMSGGASVISAMNAIGNLKPKINVTAIVPATENMPGGGAQRPGDVVKAMNGKTIEIDNTDAEGRLVLADAVAYANSIGLNRIIDVATLTGAISIALGNQCIGAFGNDQEFTNHVIESGNSVGERIWELPTFKEYEGQYSSDIADIKNTGGRGAGSITGALIINEFNASASWVHLDIAAMARTSKTSGVNIKGATGIPVRTLVKLVQNLGS